MKKILTIMILTQIVFFLFSGQIDSWTGDYDALLKKYVRAGNKYGINLNLVDYGAMSKDPAVADLKKKLESIQQPKNEPVEKQLAFWINVYNFLTIVKICENPQINSIKNLGSLFRTPWQIPAGIITGRSYTLDEIEHEIIRKNFNEPRVHFALNCSALSCPDLRNEAYSSGILYSQLDDQLARFLNNNKKGMLIDDKNKTIRLSKIFLWYSADFGNDPKAWLYIRKFISENVYKNYRLVFLDYDWRLNKF